MTERITVLEAVRNLVGEMLELESEERKVMAILTEENCIAIVSNYMVTRFRQERILGKKY